MAVYDVRPGEAETFGSTLCARITSIAFSTSPLVHIFAHVIERNGLLFPVIQRELHTKSFHRKSPLSRCRRRRAYRKRRTVSQAQDAGAAQRRQLQRRRSYPQLRRRQPAYLPF